MLGCAIFKVLLWNNSSNKIKSTGETKAPKYAFEYLRLSKAAQTLVQERGKECKRCLCNIPLVSNYRGLAP